MFPMAASSEKFELSQDDLESLLDQVRNAMAVLDKPRCRDRKSEEHKHWAAKVELFNSLNNHFLTLS